MQQVTILMDPSVVMFYTKIANTAGISAEKVMADALFKLAAELSFHAIQKLNENE